MRKPTADELRKLKDKAAEAAAKGKLDKAADLYREAAAGDTRDVGTRQKLAEVLRRAGRIPEAIHAYREVADRFGRDGLLIKAIAISKTILELDPRHVETQSALAELYAKRAAAEGTRPPPRTMVVPAMNAAGASVAAPPAPAANAPPRPATEDRLVAIPLGPPPPAPEPPPDADAIPLDILVDEPPATAAAQPLSARVTAGSRGQGGARPEPDPEHTTGFAQIVFAADAAARAGVDEDLRVTADPRDAGDEPLSFASLDQEGDATIELGPPLEPVPDEPLPPELRAPPASPPAPAQTKAPPRPSPPARPTPAAAAARSRALPRVPIFSDLSREAFLELTRGMVLHRVPEGDAVIREGEDGNSLYVVASGRFAVSRRDDAAGSVVLARLGEGDFFGEMALLSGAARSATVSAEEDGEVLELRADVLLQIAGHHPHLAQSLRRFYRQRLLANAMAVSPIFRPFQRGERKLIMERFRARDVAENDVVVREGAPSDGLYVILEGAVDVVKWKDGKEAVIGQLREGDLFGEMSCLRKAPASASIVARRPGTLLRLPRRDFDELVVTYPQILELVSTLSEERAENLDAILSGHAAWTDDGLVLT